MRICVVSTTVLTVPLAGYGGLEEIAYLQAVGLAKKGHEVMLVAPRGSRAPGCHLHETTLMEHEELAFSGYRPKLGSFDAIIDHSWMKYAVLLKMENQIKAPVLLWTHAPVNTMWEKPPPLPKPCIVCISKDQAAHAKELWGVNARVCYNGIDIDFYRSHATSTRGNRYLFLARFSSIKGPHLAVEAAMRTNIELDLVGDDKLTAEPAYLEQVKKAVQSYGGKASFIGPVSREKAVEYFSTRKALLHMNQSYREPFGLAPLEAQLCGMPVIAFDNGAMRETIKPGETGFLVRSTDEVVKLVLEDAVSKINPLACREWAKQFSVEAMVSRAEELCKEAIEKGGW